MKKHSLLWWLCIGWWWWLGFAWWVYPIKYLLLRKFSNASSDAYNHNYYQLMWETKESIIDFLKKSDGSTALQVEIKKSLSGRLVPYFDDAVHELYEDGILKTLKDGNRIRLELV